MTGLPAPLLVVTCRHQAARPLAEQVAALVAAGAGWIWLRDRDLPGAERRALAAALRRVTRRAGACLTIGGDADLAAETGADGVHLPAGAAVAAARARLGPGALVGVSAHDLAEVEEAAAGGADYVTLSPIYPTPSKPGYGPALGPAALARAAALGVPVLALGGVGGARVAACRRAGAAGIAVMGEAMRAPDPAPLVRALLARLAEAAPACQ